MEEERGKERERETRWKRPFPRTRENILSLLLFPFATKGLYTGRRTTSHFYRIRLAAPLSLSTSNPRLEVIKIFTYPRGSSKFPFHPPFGSFFLSLSLSLWASIFQISIRSILSSKNRGPSKATITVWIPNGGHPHPKIVHSSKHPYAYMSRQRVQHKTKGFSRSLADRQPTSSILRVHARSEIEMNLSLFAKIEESMEIFFSISLDN